MFKYFLLLFACTSLLAMDNPKQLKKIITSQDFKDLDVEYLDHLEFYNHEDKRPTPAEVNRLECPSRNDRLYGSLVKQHYQAPHSIEYISDKVGYGVFAQDQIRCEAMIGEYTGVVTSLAALLEMKRAMSPYLMVYSDGPATVSQDEIPYCLNSLLIDAEKKGNFTRFINHSYEPNVEPVSVITDDDHSIFHVIFKAYRTIHKGEQLLLNYGPDYWLNRNVPEKLH